MTNRCSFYLRRSTTMVVVQGRTGFRPSRQERKNFIADFGRFRTELERRPRSHGADVT